MDIIRMVDAADLEDIAVGGAILGTGGGGDPYIGKLMAQQAIRRKGKHAKNKIIGAPFANHSSIKSKPAKR